MTTATTARRISALRSEEATLLAQLRTLAVECETAEGATYERLSRQMNRIEQAAIAVSKRIKSAEAA